MTRSALIFALLGITWGLFGFGADHSPKSGASSSSADSAHKLEIKTFRFRRHGSDFERLVIEFKRGGQRPELTANRQDDGELVKLGGTTLEGDIPEAAINDSYARRAHWLGDVSFDGDAPGSNISLRIGTKNPKAKLDAFWLNGPPRLVIDAYLPGSSRDRGLTARTRPGKKVKRRLASRPTTKDNYICFPAAARVTAKVMFAEHARQEAAMRINIDPTSNDSDWDMNEVACYPESERVEAKVTFGRTEKGAEPTTTSTPVGSTSTTSTSSFGPTPASRSSSTEPQSPAPSSNQTQNQPAPLPMFSSPLTPPSALGTPASTASTQPATGPQPPASSSSSSTPPFFPDASASPSPASTTKPEAKPAERESAAPLPSTFKPPDMPPYPSEPKSATLPGFDQLIPPPGLLGPSPAPTTPH